MIDVPSIDQSEALGILLSIGNFSRSPETRGMCEWLKKELERLDAANRRELDEVVYRQRQGACQVLEDILKLADGADKTAEKIRSNISQGKGV